MNSITIHDQVYEYHSWETLGEEIFALAKQILESGEQFDRVIALAKGGLTFGRSLVDYLNIKDLSSIQVEFYTGIGTTAQTPVITQSLPVQIHHQRILLFDDVVDKGETMKLAVSYLQHHGTAKITTASLILKPWSTFAVDFSAYQTKAWVIFPNESRETIQLLAQSWRQKGDSPDQIHQQLRKIGFPQAEVEFFANLE